MSPKSRRLSSVAAVLASVLVVSVGGCWAQEATAETERPVKQIKLYVEKWKWTPDTIRVTKGTHLVLSIESFDGTRKFELRDYGLSVALPRGETVKIEFDADRAGEFSWRCSRPCGNGCAKLRGTLIVEE